VLDRGDLGLPARHLREGGPAGKNEDGKNGRDQESRSNYRAMTHHKPR